VPQAGTTRGGGPAQAGLLGERAVLDDLPQVVFRTDAAGDLTYVSHRWVEYSGLSVAETLAGAYRGAFHPSDLVALRDAWEAGMAVAAPFRVEARVRGRDGRYRWFSVQALPFLQGGQLLAWVGTLTDIDRTRVAAERTLALNRLATALAQVIGNDEVLEVVAGQAADASGARAALVAVPGEGGHLLRTVGSAGMSRDLRQPWLDFPAARPSPLSDVLRTGGPIFLRDRNEHDARYPNLIAAGDDLGLAAAAALPLQVAGRAEGALFLAFDGEQSFDEDQRAFLSGIAAFCSHALARSRHLESQIAAREEAERVSANLESLLANLPIGWAFLATDLTFERINPILAAMNGRSVAEHLGRSVWDVVPNLRAVAEPPLLRVLEERKPLVGVRISGETPAQPGAVRQWEESFYPILNQAGEAIGLGVVTLEVTEREAALEALREERERLALAVDAGRLGIWEWNLATKVRSWDGHHAELLGLPAETKSLPAEDFLRLVHPDDRADLEAAYERAIRGHFDYEHEYRVVRPDGSVRWLMGRGRATYGPDGQPLRMRGTLQDITERRIIRETLAELNRDLEQRVRERTAELEERTAELEERNAEQETFIYSASHDLHTPLVSILGMSEVLGDALTRSDQDQANYALERITRNAHHMGTLLDALLDFSRAGRDLEPSESLDLGQVTRSVLADLWPLLAHGNVAVNLPDRWPKVLLPRKEAVQVMANLLNNAARFAGRPGEQARVRLEWSSNEHYVAAHVEDNGPGVPPADRRRVFDLFRKLDPSSDGAGVGLAIVRRIVERHGGRIWVEDSPLGGACFTFTLPRDPD
jgi:PAS domain S-box-containing protein